MYVHNLTIEQAPGATPVPSDDGPLVFGRCSCGWSCGPRREVDARADHVAHVRQVVGDVDPPPEPLPPEPERVCPWCGGDADHRTAEECPDFLGRDADRYEG